MTKSKIKWLIIYLFAITIVLFVLFHRPAYYKPQPVPDNKQLSTYLTHQLIPQFYNGAQLQEPFDIVITQQGINDIISRLPLPEKSQKVNLTSPAVTFATDKILIVAAANVHGARLIITLEVAPTFNEKGLLNVNMNTVKIGAMSVTFAARVLARQMYADKFDPSCINPDDIRSLLAASFFAGKPFDPVFTIDGKKIRLNKVTITNTQLLLHFIPIPDTAAAITSKY